jgi:hypothetical protein
MKLTDMISFGKAQVSPEYRWLKNVSEGRVSFNSITLFTILDKAQSALHQ